MIKTHSYIFFSRLLIIQLNKEIDYKNKAIKLRQVYDLDHELENLTQIDLDSSKYNCPGIFFKKEHYIDIVLKYY